MGSSSSTRRIVPTTPTRRWVGRIMQDRLWFFTSHRVFGYQNILAGRLLRTSTQNTPFYTPDPSRPALHQEDNISDGIRFTYQLTKKDKVNASWDFQHTNICLGCSPLVAPEATYTTKYADPNYLLQGKWTHLASNKLFFEVADSTLIFNWPNHRKPEAHGDLHSESQYRLPLQRAAGLEPGPARRQRIQPARLGELRHRFTRLQGGLHDAGSVAPRLV